MTKIYMVRHCEAMGNVKRVFQGSTDFDISDVGEQQLEYLKERFKDIEFDRIYSSPLKRARKTAEAVLGERKMLVQTEFGLRELSGGFVEGKPFVEAFNAIPSLADAWDNHPQDFAPPGGEPMRDAYKRIWNTVLRLAKYNKDKTIVCATHGGVMRCLLCRLLKGSIEHLVDMPWSENTAVTLIEFNDAFEPKVIFYNDISHLPKELIPVRSRLSSYINGGKK